MSSIAETTDADLPRPGAGGRAGGSSIYVAFVPWVLFSAIAQRDTLEAASIVGLVAALAIALVSLRFTPFTEQYA